MRKRRKRRPETKRSHQKTLERVEPGRANDSGRVSTGRVRRAASESGCRVGSNFWAGRGTQVRSVPDFGLDFWTGQAGAVEAELLERKLSMADSNLQRARESACGDRWGRFLARLTRDGEKKRLMAAVTNENVGREAKNERQRASKRRNKWLAGELLTAREEAAGDESGLVVLGTERRRWWSWW
ncbi:hypothetical protein PIB30_006904 [Stylosanthes scabra]|uniref:Uncharacterized protein n=1 Tax=Stylosanthes scabra TaxID=79078 RepID=A0ABU6X2A1_9FABA|nr:hypothetical protein [Stylosanthes scabra]